jgi:hypothetical protein
MNNEDTTPKRERRFTERFIISEGVAYFRFLRKFSLISNFNGPFPMYDIASNSARFECPKEIELKSEIELKILPPNHPEELRIKGKVIKSADSVHHFGRAYVVLFSPFGKGYRYNSYQCKSKLRHYIQKMKAQKSADPPS